MEQCDRCNGKGKIQLFSSWEDPCEECGGSGKVPSTKPKTKPQKTKASKPSKAPVTTALDEFFNFIVKRDPKQGEIDTIKVNQAPRGPDVTQILSDFQVEMEDRLDSVYDALTARRPAIYYRGNRVRCARKVIKSSKMPHHLSNNKHKPRFKQPKKSLIVFAKEPIVYALYYTWK